MRQLTTSRMCKLDSPRAAARRSRTVEALEGRTLLTASGGVDPTAGARDAAVEFFNASDAVFVANEGQWADASVKYAFNGLGINVGFTDAGPVLEVLRAKAPVATVGTSPMAPGAPGARDAQPSEMERARITLSFDGAQPVTPVGVDRSATSFNYLVGEQSRHRSDVAGYTQVRYAGLYPGVDLLTRGRRDGLKYEFHVAPGADWRDIRISYGGTVGLSLGADGSLRVATSLGELVEQAPVLYQGTGQDRVEVPARFVLVDADTYAFDVTGTYDPARELVIDPDLAWATYLGGNNGEVVRAMAMDGAGNLYVTGKTWSAGWATPGAYDTTFTPYLSNADAFMAKLDPSGSSLLYATYLGGIGHDSGVGIAVDGDGNAYVAGGAESPGLATPGAFDTTHNGGNDIFVAKLDASGSSLLYNTYLGGSGDDAGVAIALDGAGNAYVTGYTGSGGWATRGAYDTTFNGGDDAFVAELNGSGSSLLFATYLGGSGGDYCAGVARDGAGNVYVTGSTDSAGWATPGAYDTTYNGGGFDVIVAKVNPSGSSLLYATYLGGSGDDSAFGIAVDGAGNAHLTGTTGSSGWATPGAYDIRFGGSSDIFVADLSASGSSLVYATYLGTSGDNGGYAIAVDSAGNAYVTGATGSAGWATAGAYDTTYNGGVDAFVAMVNASGSSLLYASFLGGSGLDYGGAIVVDGAGNAYVGGGTHSPGWATPGAFDSTFHAAINDNGFVAKFNQPGAAKVLGRRVFYNHSAFDGNDAAANAADDAAIAADKNALLAGQDRLPAFDNVTGYPRGLNGIMVDMAGLPQGAALSADDFDFAGAAPPSVTVRRRAGVGGSDRVTLIWPDYDPLAPPATRALANGWLTVTVKANARTGLAAPDVFSFGNLVGDTGNAGALRVDAADLLRVRAARSHGARADAACDVNRDGRVDVVDAMIVRSNLSHSLTLLNQPLAPAESPQPSADPSSGRPPMRHARRVGYQANGDVVS